MNTIREYKNKILMLVSIIVLVILFTKNSIAVSLGSSSSGLQNVKNQGANAVGNTVTARYYDMITRRDLYCVMHNVTLRGNVLFNVQRFVTITGNTATNDLGHTYSSTENGKLAYILNRGEGYGQQGNYSTTQKLLYRTINGWYTDVGSKLGVNGSIRHWQNDNIALNSNEQYIMKQAQDYANNLGNVDSKEEGIKDNTNTNNIKVTGYNENNIEYLRVGPFNWSYSGKLTSIKVYGDNNRIISGVKFSRYSGNEEVFYDNTSNIISGRNFYITIRADAGFTKIGKIVATHKSTNVSNVYKAKLWFLHTNGMQDLVLVDTSTDIQQPNEVDTPFNYDIQLTKTIEIIKSDSIKKDKRLSNVGFILQNKETGKYVQKSGSTYNFVTRKENATEFITDRSGKITVKDLPIAVYVAYETINPIKGYELKEEATVIGLNDKNITITNDYKLGEISLEKVDKNHTEIKLKSVEFTLIAKTGKYAGKYVGIDSNGNATYSDTEVIIKTDENGKLNIKEIWEGKYTLTEVNNPNYGYIIDPESQNIELEVKPYEVSTRQIKNEQVYIRLSGFIWHDINAGKRTERNDYYRTDGIPNEYVDDQDQSFDGITVRLKRISDNSIVTEGYADRKEFTDKKQETISQERNLYSEIDGGEYVFEYVRVEELSDYYVEFEYDGLIYQSVVTHLDHNNGSKADDKVEREILDRNFATVDSTGENRVNVNNIYSITYNQTVDHATSIKDSSSCVLHAKTNDAECNINNYFVPGQTEIRYINLGLYEKPQADMALAQDLQNVNVGVNGYWHIYNYGTRKVDTNESDSWNVGVKFKNDYTGSYKRAIYKADMEYETEDKNKELQVYLTYKIALKNESSYITRINNIVDYFDSKYTLVSAGTGLDKNNNITGTINFRDISNYNNDYQVGIIDVNSVIAPGESQYIYVQFKLDRQAVLNIMNNKETLYHKSEINSYTVFKDSNGNTVAALDVDSVPGNTKIENIDTYEDDTDSAPPVQLEVAANARKIQGSVFVDSTSEELRIGQIRQGNGIFDDGENIVPNVQVKLHEENNSIDDMETITDENGNFEFSGYIPGKYTVTYIWGDKTYTVQNYKGTIYDSSRNQDDMYWYKDKVDERKTDAIDNYETRKAIDAEVASVTNSTINEQIKDLYENGTNHPNITISKMDSMTPIMEFGVEYETTVTDGTDDKLEFIVKNIDFGIVERARQQLDMAKRVKSFKITLANGQILVDATVDENGELQGTHNNVTYMGPSVNNGFADSGYIKAEIDNELLEGATLEIGYEIKAINNSELDYMSEKYYKYGIQEGNVVTLTPAAVVDYLDKNLGFEANKNPDWQQINVDKLKELKASKVSDVDFLNSRTIIYTEKTATPLQPTQNVSVDLNVSKLLTTSKDLTFRNDAETVTITKWGRNPDSVTNNHLGSVVRYFPIDDAEEVQVTPSTGDDKGYVLPIVVGMSALIVLGFGIVVIKRKIIDN